MTLPLYPKRASSPRLPRAKPLPAPDAKPAAPRDGASPPECWKVDRVAKILDVSKKRVYCLVGEGRLEAIRLGPRQMRILRRSLDDLLARLRREETEREP